MKRIISFILTVFIFISLGTSAVAVTVGDDNHNIYNSGFSDASYGDYIEYLKTLCAQRGTVYSEDELIEIYNQVSFYMLNKFSIESSDKKLQTLIDCIMLVGVRTDSECNCVEVVIRDLTKEKAELFSEYICDSDAVVLWNNNCSLTAPSSEYTETDVEIRPKVPTTINLKSGQTKTVPVANRDKVLLWRSSDESTVLAIDGCAVACKKGAADVTAVYSSAVELTFHCNVTDDPALLYKGKKVSSISVKKGKSVSVKLTGKASSINNSYTSTKRAKITSKKTAKTITIKGLKKGTTSVKIKVNNSVTFKIKVKVK